MSSKQSHGLNMLCREQMRLKTPQKVHRTGKQKTLLEMYSVDSTHLPHTHGKSTGKPLKMLLGIRENQARIVGWAAVPNFVHLWHTHSFSRKPPYHPFLLLNKQEPRLPREPGKSILKICISCRSMRVVHGIAPQQILSRLSRARWECAMKFGEGLRCA